jgi:hypothetical protein
MPGLDRTGPEGQGPRTGRQMGKCKPRKGSVDPGNIAKDEKDKNGLPENGPENDGPFYGRGRGLGRGFGRGPGRGRGRGMGPVGYR